MYDRKNPLTQIELNNKHIEKRQKKKKKTSDKEVKMHKIQMQILQAFAKRSFNKICQHFSYRQGKLVYYMRF